MSQVADSPTTGAPAPADESLYEVVNGQRVELPPMGSRESVLASTLVIRLGAHAVAQRLGRVVGEVLFQLDTEGDLRRRPDLAFVSYERWPRDRPIPGGEEAWDVVPDLAVEVVSPTNTASSIIAKVRDYFAAGVRRVWVIYPDEPLIYVYESPRRPRVVGPEESLDGDDVLPGFRVGVAELFEDVAGVG